MRRGLMLGLCGRIGEFSRRVGEGNWVLEFAAIA